MTDLLAGRVQVTFDPLPSSIGYIRSGKLRALAVTTANRAEPLPDTPTVGESVAGFEARAWYGVGAPKNTPREIASKLNLAVNEALADPGIKARLGELGGVVLPGTPAMFSQLVAAEIEKWSKVIRAANITAM